MAYSSESKKPIKEVFDLITDYADWNVSSIQYGSVKTNAKGGKSVPILDNKKQPLHVRTPMVFNWGAQCTEDEVTGRKSYRVSIQHRTNSGPEEKQYYDKMKEFEDKIKSDSVTNCKEWFNKSTMSSDVVDALFNPMNKYPNIKGTKEPDYTRDPTNAAKVPFWNEKFGLEIYNMQEEKIFGPDTDLSSTTFESFIPKGSYMSAILQCKGIWFVNGKFGVTWQLIQCVVKKPYRIQDACYIRLSDNEKSYMKKIEEKEKSHVADSEHDEYQSQHVSTSEHETVDDVTVDDSEDEEVEVEKKEPEPEKVKEVTVPKKKKRVIRKKA